MGDCHFTHRFTRTGLTAFLAGAAILLTFTSTASAQVLYGSIVGNITDPNGAPIPRVAVVVTDQATGASQTVTTDANGTYQVVNLQPGT